MTFCLLSALPVDWFYARVLGLTGGVGVFSHFINEREKLEQDLNAMFGQWYEGD